MSHYGTLAGSVVYFTEERLDNGGVWAAANVQRKTAALTQATRSMDRLNYIGDKAEEDQELEFPRDDQTEVPETIEHACYEIAHALLSGRDPDYENERVNTMVQSIGPSRVVKNLRMVPEHVVASIPSETAWKLIKPWLRDGRSITLSRID